MKKDGITPHNPSHVSKRRRRGEAREAMLLGAPRLSKVCKRGRSGRWQIGRPRSSLGAMFVSASVLSM